MSSLILRLAAAVAGVVPEAIRRSLYRSGPLASLVRALLTWAAPDRLTEVEIAAGPLAGARMSLDLKREKTFWLGNYEPELMHAIDRFGRQGMLAYDVGANIGYVSLALARRAGRYGSVVAFEPLPANLTRMRSHLALNPEGQRVSVVGAAVAERSSQSEFLVHRSGGMGKLAGAPGRAAQYDEKLSVVQIALDDWCAAQSAPAPELIKIDVEGGEELVLRGMLRLLGSARPVLLIELHGPEAAVQTIEILERANYRVCEMRDGYPAFAAGKAWKSYVVGLPAELLDRELPESGRTGGTT